MCARVPGPCERARACAQRHVHVSAFVFACARVCARLCQTWVCGCLMLSLFPVHCVHACVILHHVCAGAL
jgi:hypothetical protein